ncbi:MAG: hypothetical protein Q7T10_14545 [Rhodoferax sp.]|uniref:hypothetical protein n=1 Tax=Rhodoferax sp. TaxID=50421 RepID=UPI002716F709|nr:hypothetical protein [Rhodoferax sp.]MDO8450014.1 hypothetical protein [Rhodoferax sp.]
MAYSLRLPDALDAAARAKADYLGISLNALLCVALDAYLRHPADPPAPASEPASASECPSKTTFREPAAPGESGPVEPAKLTRAEKQARYEAEKRERKALSGR